MNLTYYSRTQSSLDLTFPLGFVQTPVSICTQRHQILQIRTAAVYIHSAKWEYLHKEPRLWRIKHPQPAASKNHEINSLSIYQISVPFFEHQHHHQLDDAWYTLPPPPSCARNWTEAANLKTSKKSPWAHSTNPAAFGRMFVPALLWGAVALQRKLGAIICPPLLASQDVPFPHGQMARPNFGGSRRKTPVDFSGSWTTAKVNFLLNMQFPAMELLRRSLSPWYLKYCWYRERPAWTPSKINVFL